MATYLFTHLSDIPAAFWQPDKLNWDLLFAYIVLRMAWGGSKTRKKGNINLMGWVEVILDS